MNFCVRFVNLGHRKNVSQSNVWLTMLAWWLRKNNRDRLMLRLSLQVLLRWHDKLLLQAFLRGPTTKTIKVILRGQKPPSPLMGTGAIQSPLVGTGTFQSNSPVGVGSVHDIHASNIDLNAQAWTEMLSNPFMWMFNSPNQQDFWKDFIDKRVQKALNPTLLRSAATFISNTTTSVSTSVSCTANLFKCQT